MPRAVLFAAWATLASATFARPSTVAAGMTEVKGIRNTRYCEIFVVTRHGFSATAAVYNTIGLGSCPEQQWRALRTDTLKEQTGAYRIVLNGPRYFVMDRNALRDPGPERDLGGLKTHLVAKVEVKRANENRAPFTEYVVYRRSCYVYEAGKNVYRLYSPGRRSYIMQSYSVEVDPNLDEAALTHLASRLPLLKGWRYEARKLTSDLTVCNSGGKAYVLQDSFQNTYQALDP